jgi:hypothetical protein
MARTRCGPVWGPGCLLVRFQAGSLGGFAGSEDRNPDRSDRGAGKRYPDNDRYTVWLGPKSNTFTAFIAREVLVPRVVLPISHPGGE